MKSITDASTGASHVKSASRVKLRAAPKKAKDTAYLDLFLLSKERTRLHQEQSHLDRRQGQNQKKLAEVEANMQSAEKAVGERGQETDDGEGPPPEQKRPPRKNWQRMALDY